MAQVTLASVDADTTTVGDEYGASAGRLIAVIVAP
jgi:hypothetical protein